MKHAFPMSVALAMMAACSPGGGSEPGTTNEPGSTSVAPPPDDGDSGSPVGPSAGDVDHPGDTGANADTDTTPPGDDGPRDGDPGPSPGDAPAHGDPGPVDPGPHGDSGPFPDTGPISGDPGPGPAPGDGASNGCAVQISDVPLQEPWRHWPQDYPIKYDQNPPAGGQDYEMWAQYGVYSEPLGRGHWNHNLRHGAIVMVYRPDAPADIVQALHDAVPFMPTPGGKYEADPKCPRMTIVTPDPLMDDDYAVLAYGKMLTSDCAPAIADIIDFATEHVYEAPEKECFDGAWPVRPPCYRYETVRFGEWTREVPTGSEVTYDDYPPSSGAFYPETLAYGRYATYVPAPYWTKILAKGGVVVLYRPDADPDMITTLETAYDGLTPHWKCGHSYTAMVQDPNLITPYAVVADGQYMDGECFEGWELNMFVYSRRGYGPTAFNSCDDGTYVPPEP